MSKVYLVERTDDIGYDEYDSYVVVAKSSGQARQFCGKNHADEGDKIWLADTTRTTLISKYALDETPRIVLESFNAG